MLFEPSQQIGAHVLARKYQFMEANKQRAAIGHREKIPDIQKTLDMVKFLETRKVCQFVMHIEGILGADLTWQPGADPIETTFELNDTLYAKANIQPTEEVYLWLGVSLPYVLDSCRDNADLKQANVMLSYPIDEADELLTARLATAKHNLTNCEEDLDFLREQITVSIHKTRISTATGCHQTNNQ